MGFLEKRVAGEISLFSLFLFIASEKIY